jgi:hypothetical protein
LYSLLLSEVLYSVLIVDALSAAGYTCMVSELVGYIHIKGVDVVHMIE